MKKKLLVTGCGRSGTLYITSYLQKLGLDVRHEEPVPPNGVMGKDGMVSWFMAADDPNPPMGPGRSHYEFEYVLHLVRHPLKVIASVAQFIFKLDIKSYKYIKKHCRFDHWPTFSPTLEKELLIKLATEYWLCWNKITNSIATHRARIEFLDEDIFPLLDVLSLTSNIEVTNDIPKTVNSRSKHIDDEIWSLSWAQLHEIEPDLFDKVKVLAKEYGYND